MARLLLTPLAGVRLENGGNREPESAASTSFARGAAPRQSGKSHRCESLYEIALPLHMGVGTFLGISRRVFRGALMAVNLEGVRLRRWPAPAGVKSLVSKSLAGRNLVSYEIVGSTDEASLAAAKPREKRSSARRRLRLRSAKLLDSRNAFICECLVRDQSAQGLCLKLMKNIGLPARCILYDDETGALEVVTTIWRRGSLLGVRYSPVSTPIARKPSDRSALRGRYYAVPD
jgi:hypothetical protein